MQELIVQNGRKYVAVDYVFAMLDRAAREPKMDVSFTDVVFANWFEVGWRKCAEQLRRTFGML